MVWSVMNIVTPNFTRHSPLAVPIPRMRPGRDFRLTVTRGRRKSDYRREPGVSLVPEPSDTTGNEPFTCSGVGRDPRDDGVRARGPLGYAGRGRHRARRRGGPHRPHG